MDKRDFRILNHFLSTARKGISPLIGFVLTTALITAAVTIVLTVIKPTFDRMSDSGIIDEGIQNLELINSKIMQVASEPGSKRTISLSVSEGEYGIDTTKDFIYFNYSTKTDFSLQGTIKNERLDKSPVFIDYFNNYLENSNASPPWTIKNGAWQVNSGEYSGQNGLAYYNFGNVVFFEIEGRMTNKAGTNGEIFALPVSPNDLVGYWTFDEGSGNYTYDYSGLNNTGTLNGMNTVGNATSGWTSTGCIFGSCLKFDGVDDVVNINNRVGLNPATAISLEIWMKANAIGGAPYFNGRPWYWGQGYWLSTGNGLFFELQTTVSGDNYLYSTNSLSTNVWYQVVVTYDSTVASNNAKMYLNGNFDNQGTWNGTIVPFTAYGGWTNIGYADYAASRFNGTIDEVKIYNRSLTADEVKSDYELGIKKLSSTGRTDSVSASTNVYLVLSNPSGNTNFDEVKIKTNKRVMMLSVPYVNVDLNGTARFPKGNYQLTIMHMGVNTTVNKPIVELTLA